MHQQQSAFSRSQPDQAHAFLFEPNVRIFGPIDNSTYWSFMDQVAAVRKCPPDQPMILELNTQGGDADVARRIALEVKLCRNWHNRTTFVVGKSYVYSAGITIMAAFPRDNRYVSEDTYLLIHERRLNSTVELKGPVRSNIQILREQLAAMETADEIERQGFAEFAEGSELSLEALYEKASENFYLTAGKAVELGLVSAVI